MSGDRSRRSGPAPNPAPAAPFVRIGGCRPINPPDWWTQQDSDGSVSSASTPVSFTVDVPSEVAPPIILLPTPGAPLRDRTPTFSGIGAPGATVTVSDGRGVLCTALVAGDGSWSCTSEVDLPLGVTTIVASQVTPSGSASDESTKVSVTITASGGLPASGSNSRSLLLVATLAVALGLLGWVVARRRRPRVAGGGS